MRDALIDMVCAGSANAVSTAILNPSDVTKLRLQSPGGAALYAGLGDAIRKIAHEQGVSALWTIGLAPTLLREVFYSTTRMGLYVHVKRALSVDDHSLLGKIAASALTGSLGSILSNPIDVVKVGMMAEAGSVGRDGLYVSGLRKGHPPTWPSTVSALGDVFAGGNAFRGASANVARGTMMAASQLASYDHSKHLLRERLGAHEGVPLHVVCSQISAVCATFVTAPADMLKTRLMGDRVGAYCGLLDCLRKTARQEGVLALWNGALPSYLRLGPHFVMTLPLYEFLRKRAGLGFL